MGWLELLTLRSRASARMRYHRCAPGGAGMLGSTLCQLACMQASAPINLSPMAVIG